MSLLHTNHLVSQSGEVNAGNVDSSPELSNSSLASSSRSQDQQDSADSTALTISQTEPAPSMSETSNGKTLLFSF